MIAACLCLTGMGTANTQWVVFDSGNLAQNIINSAKEMVETAGTKANTFNGSLEAQRTFQQGKKYYDALKSVYNMVKGGVKVSKSIFLVMEVSEIYVDNYRRMLSDENHIPEELAAILPGYTTLIDESPDVLQDLKNVVNVTGMSFSDVERLVIIENTYRSLMNYRNLVRYCTNKTISVSYLRVRKKDDMGRVTLLYGTADEKYQQAMGESDSLHQVPLSPHDEMMPLCAGMAGVAKGLAGLGVLFHAAMHMWQSLARAEAIDVYPPLRPFALDLCTLFFPTIVLGTMNGVPSPIVQGVHGILEMQTLDMNEYREQKDKLEHEALMRNPETVYLTSDEEFDRQLDELGQSPFDLVTVTGIYMDRAPYNVKKDVRGWFRELLELMFTVAALIIDMPQTFFLAVFSIPGPTAFAFAVWDDFHSALPAWFSRYIQIYLWLPVSDLFSTILAKIQILMLRRDIEHMQADPNFSPDASDGVYVVLPIIGIVGCFIIPTVAGWIIQAEGGIGNYNKDINTAGALGDSAASVAAGNATGHAGKLIKGTAGKIFRKQYVMSFTSR